MLASLTYPTTRMFQMHWAYIQFLKRYLYTISCTCCEIKGIFLSKIVSDSFTRISIGVRKDVICWHSSPIFNVLFRQERQYRAARDQMVICSSTMWPPSWQTESAVLSTAVTSRPPGRAAPPPPLWYQSADYTCCDIPAVLTSGALSLT